MTELELDILYERAYRGDSASIALAIEPIGNDDHVTEKLVNLLNMARDDKHERDPRVVKVRNNEKLRVLEEFLLANDAYFGDL